MITKWTADTNIRNIYYKNAKAESGLTPWFTRSSIKKKPYHDNKGHDMVDDAEYTQPSGYRQKQKDRETGRILLQQYSNTAVFFTKLMNLTAVFMIS